MADKPGVGFVGVGNMGARVGRRAAGEDRRAGDHGLLSRKFDAGFTMSLLAMDLSIALQVGRETNTPAPLSALCKEMVASAQAMFSSDADHTEMAKFRERLAGTQLGEAR